MKEFRGKVAVVTGAASGIGLGIAMRCVSEGVKVVLADIAEDRLSKVEHDIRGEGSDVLAIKCDVSKSGDVERLAKETVREFGEIHLLFNNAGVGSIGDGIHPLWKASDHDWELIIGVNLWGVINGIRILVPIMLDQNTEGHIVNTASLAGLRSHHNRGIYAMTKHAVVCLSETLHNQLADMGSRIGVSVLCPGWVRTDIAESALDRHIRLQESKRERDLSKEEEKAVEQVLEGVQSGMSPSAVSDIVFDAIRNERFYIITHPQTKEYIRTRMECILEERNPV